MLFFLYINTTFFVVKQFWSVLLSNLTVVYGSFTRNIRQSAFPKYFPQEELINDMNLHISNMCAENPSTKKSIQTQNLFLESRAL